MSKPRLSFVVPVYKPKPDVFEKHCKALAAQALESWEAIFVLDGPCPQARPAKMAAARSPAEPRGSACPTTAPPHAPGP